MGGSAEPDPAPSEPIHGEETSQVPPRRLGLVAVVAVVTLVADQLSKAWALRALQDGPIDVFWDLHLELAYNTGAAFSLGGGQGLGPWITLLAIGVVVAVALGHTSRFPLGAVAAGMISGGAVGNLLDRAFRSNPFDADAGLLHGAVVDFIALDWWPTFNIADAGIVVGAGLLMLAAFRSPSP